MKKKIMIILGILGVCYVGFSIFLSHVEENARESFEEGNFCASYQKLKWTSLLTKEGKRMLGSLYARGSCVNQDIHRAMELYQSVYGDEQLKIGEILFYDALEASDADERGGKEKRPQIIQSLFLEAKALGFNPSEKDFKELEQSNLRAEFESTQIKK